MAASVPLHSSASYGAFVQAYSSGLARAIFQPAYVPTTGQVSGIEPVCILVTLEYCCFHLYYVVVPFKTQILRRDFYRISVMIILPGHGQI